MGDGTYFMEHRTAKGTYLKVIQDELMALSASDPKQESCTLCQSAEVGEEREYQQTR